MFSWPDLSDSALIWGLAARGIALIYIIALTSIRIEIMALCGSRGISPLTAKLAHLKAELGVRRALLRHPSLFWISSSDVTLRWLPVAGIIAATLALSGVASPAMLALTWVIYLSLDVAIGMTFPWESMLFEAGLLALCLPPLAMFPSLRISATPGAVLLLAFLWLLFRVLFGFGKNKFTPEATRDPVYLRAFLVSQPMPSPLGWRAFRLPRAVLVSSNAALFGVEMILPFFIFFPGWPRLLAGAAFCGLMLSIQAMGNFGFFNMLVIVLCLPLLDARSVAWPWLQRPDGARDFLTMVLVTWTLIAGLLHLPFNTFVARGWPEWPAWAALPRGWRAVVATLRESMPFRTVHAYGVFPPQIGPPIKWLPVVEGTLDGMHWRAFEYRYMPSTPFSPPRFVAPHVPRVDHFAIYEGCGVGAGNYLGTIFSQANPYDFSTVGSLDRLLQRLMEPQTPVRQIFGVDPFDGVPPVRMRIRTYAFSPTGPGERAATGRYWHMDFVHEHAPERGRDDTIWQRWLPSGEQLHPDERWGRRRVPRIAPLLRATNLEEVRAALDRETAAYWTDFWGRLMPRARAACASGWPAVVGLARDLQRSLPPAAIDRYDRIRGAVSTALLERIEPHVLGHAAPVLDTRSYFHASLLAHALMLDGMDAVVDVLAAPRSLIESPIDGFDERGLQLVTLLRLEMMLEHARTQRLADTMRLGPPPASKAVPGFIHLAPLLARSLPDPEQRLPDIARGSDGEWRIDGMLFTARTLDAHPLAHAADRAS